MCIDFLEILGKSMLVMEGLGKSVEPCLCVCVFASSISFAEFRTLFSSNISDARVFILEMITSIPWKENELNMVDTPGHADFGGEVERVVGMVEGAILVVDAGEGPLAQTKFVLAKALRYGLRPILLLNKVDRPFVSEERCDEVESLVFDLFANLGASGRITSGVVRINDRVHGLRHSDSGSSKLKMEKGELQLGILLENMRRENFELSVSPPKVMYKIEKGVKLEPIERAEVTDMGPVAGNFGRTRMTLTCPSRLFKGLVGYRSVFSSDTRGTGFMHRAFLGMFLVNELQEKRFNKIESLLNVIILLNPICVYTLNTFITVDVISAIEFDKAGDHLATGDRGGRVVLFERTDQTNVQEKKIKKICNFNLDPSKQLRNGFICSSNAPTSLRLPMEPDTEICANMLDALNECLEICGQVLDENQERNIVDEIKQVITRVKKHLLNNQLLLLRLICANGGCNLLGAV
ncbi:hypothetical protein LXL04_020277 [Taraxacum kok-saghyz]